MSFYCNPGSAPLCSDNVNILTQRFIRKLDGCIKTNFRKIRVNKANKSKEEYLLDKLRNLKANKDADSLKEVDHIIGEIAKIGEEKYTKVLKELE